MQQVMRVAVSVAIALAAAASDAAAQATVFIVRHAERADAGSPSSSTAGSDPELSAAGQARAASLARMLAETGITAIYATEYKRTQQTAAPLATSLDLQVTTIKAAESARLVDALKSATGNVLVVGHSNTVPEVIKALGVRTPVAIGDSEYDNLFVVITGPEPRLIRLQFR